MIETIQIATGGVAAGARVAGNHGPGLIFVHGVGSIAEIWDTQLAEFGKNYRCAAIELRGNGVPKPEPDPSAITREGFAQDVLAVADALGLEDFTMVGCSLGGVVTFEVWKTAPERITAAAIIGSFAQYPDGQANADGIKAAVVAAGSMEVFARERAAKLGLPPERLRQTIEHMARKTVPSYLASTQATWTGDYRSVLPSIDVPVIVACGEHDLVAPLALSQAIASGIPNARLEVVENAGHVANADNPQRFNELLREFLDSVYLPAV